MAKRGGKHRPDKCSFGCYWTAPDKALFKTAAEAAGMSLSDMVTEILRHEAICLCISDLHGNVTEKYRSMYERHLAGCIKQTEDYKRTVK